jgi:hypothetical protein
MKGNILFLFGHFHHFEVISSFLWNLIDSWESWVDGLLSYMKMILIIFLRAGSDNCDANGLS